MLVEPTGVWRRKMGADGGSIPKRSEMVKTAAKKETADKETMNYEKWNLCAISMEPLQQPVVACRLGKLYNKESVIKFLLDKSAYEEISEAFSHISGLKDVKELNLKEIKTDGKGTKFICPLSGKEMNGNFRFFVSWPCGCVYSEQALKELNTDDGACIVCGKEVQLDDRIPLNGTSEEVEQLRSKLATAKPKKLKASKRKQEQDEDSFVVVKRQPVGLPGEILALKRTKVIDELYNKRK